MCEHYECRCALAAKYAAMDMTLEAVLVHRVKVPCLRPQGKFP